MDEVRCQISRHDIVGAGVTMLSHWQGDPSSTTGRHCRTNYCRVQFTCRRQWVQSVDRAPSTQLCSDRPTERARIKRYNCPALLGRTLISRRAVSQQWLTFVTLAWESDLAHSVAAEKNSRLARHANPRCIATSRQHCSQYFGDKSTT